MFLFSTMFSISELCVLTQECVCESKLFFQCILILCFAFPCLLFLILRDGCDLSLSASVFSIEQKWDGEQKTSVDFFVLCFKILCCFYLAV